MHPVKGVGVDLEAELVGNGGMCIRALVEPEMAAWTMMAFSKLRIIHDIACGDTGFHQLHQLCTGVVGSLLQLRGSGRHIKAVPGSIRPRASAMTCMVEAVPIKEQAPQLGQACCL